MNDDELLEVIRPLLPPGWTAEPYGQEYVGVLHGHDYGWADGVIVLPPGSVGLNYELLPLVDGRLHAEANGTDVYDEGDVTELTATVTSPAELVAELVAHEAANRGRYETETS